MRFVFVQTCAFEKEAVRLDLTLDDIRAIENQISESPHRWPTIAGVPGLRKMRFSPGRRSGGKSGGVRVCYLVIDRASHVFLVALFAKNEKQNLSPQDRNVIRNFVARTRKFYEE